MTSESMVEMIHFKSTQAKLVAQLSSMTNEYQVEMIHLSRLELNQSPYSPP
jgi:hypothetical protein